MSNYVKATDFATKDSLTTGDPNKKVKGTEINAEFNAIATAIATKADLASPVLTGTPQAPSPSGSDDSTRIATTEWIRDFLNAYEPLGTIKMYVGLVESIPTGWALCNGSNDTVDLRDRFVVGSGSTYSVRDTGGSATVTLGTADIPAHVHPVGITTGNESTSHTHSVSGSTAGIDVNHTHSITGYLVDAGLAASGLVRTDNGISGQSFTTGNESQSHTHSFSATTSGVSTNHTHSVTGNTGLNENAGGAHENRPPYYAVMFIQKISNI